VSILCNAQAAELDAPTIEAKSALGRSVSIAVLGALSDCYKAIENLQTEHAAKTEVVYLRSAAAKLETGEKALHEMWDILASSSPSDEVVAWLRGLDFERLYQDGMQRGLISPSRDQWDRLVQLIQTQNYLDDIVEVLIADANSVRTRIESLIEMLTSLDTATSLKRDEVNSMLSLQAALAEFAVFGQMVAYINAIEPLTGEWREAVAIATVL
jgi:hypothetical protein